MVALPDGDNVEAFGSRSGEVPFTQSHSDVGDSLLPCAQTAPSADVTKTPPKSADLATVAASSNAAARVTALSQHSCARQTFGSQP